MKLLICTQAVDKLDTNLGFFHRWIEEFAAHCEQVIVVCLRRGEYSFPSNVRVLSLGKESGSSRLSRILKFFSYIMGNRRYYDAVFVHMNAEYAVLGGWLWRRWGKKVGLWYAHKSVTQVLRFAMQFIDVVFTVSGSSFKIASDKVRAVGHGIDTEAFKPDMREASIETRFVTSGRLAQSKHLIEMLQVFDVLHERGELFTFTIIGEAGTPEEEGYAARLRQEIGKRPYNAKVIMRGGILHDNLPQVLHGQSWSRGACHWRARDYDQ
jgi:glycosyltransferase involved in cell wall biosynthesis